MEIIRVVEKRASFGRAITDTFDEMPVVAQIGAIAALPVVALAAVTIGLEAAAIAGAACGAAALVSVIGSSPIVTQRDVTFQDLTDIADPDGRTLQVGFRYAPHPLRTNVYIKTDQHHHEVIREQQTHLISYIRSVVAVRRLIISIAYHDEVNVDTESPIFNFGFGARQDIKGAILSDLTYDRPKRIQSQSDIFWLDHFTNIREALREGDTGRKIFKEEFGRNIECNVAVAKKFGFKRESVKSYSLYIKIEI